MRSIGFTRPIVPNVDRYRIVVVALAGIRCTQTAPRSDSMLVPTARAARRTSEAHPG